VLSFTSLSVKRIKRRYVPSHCTHICGDISIILYDTKNINRHGDQTIALIPEMDMVVVMTASPAGADRNPILAAILAAIGTND